MAPGDRLLAIGLPGLGLVVVGLAASRAVARRRLARALDDAERAAQESLRGAAEAERRRVASGVRHVVRRDVDTLVDRVAEAARVVGARAGAPPWAAVAPAGPPVSPPADDVVAALGAVGRAAATTLEDLRELLDAVDPPPAGPDRAPAPGSVEGPRRTRPSRGAEPAAEDASGTGEDGGRRAGRPTRRATDALAALGVPPLTGLDLPPDVAGAADGPRPVSPAARWTGRPPLVDVALALGVAGIVVLDVTVLPVSRPVLSVVLGISSTALPLAVRRRAPLVVSSAAAVGLVGGAALGVLPPGPVAPYFILTIVPFAAASHAETVGRALVGVAITSGAAIVAVAPQHRAGGWPGPRDLAALAGYGVLAGAVTWFARHHRIRALALAIDADVLRRRHPAIVRAVRHEERSRVARDLHDAVSHGVTVCAVLAGAAAATARTGAPVGPRDLVPLHRAAERVHRELDALVRALAVPGEPVPRDGAAGNALGPLVALVRDAGPGIPLRIDVPDARDVTPPVADAAYRIVQEALTNAARHGGAPATGVVVRASGEVLEIEVVSGRSDGPPVDRPAVPAGGGRGLPGMRRRVQGLGGRLDAGPLPDGGFRVAARLPLAR